MTNIIKISGQITKNGSYYLLKTEDFEILIVCHSLQYLEKFMGEHVTITGRLRKVKAFHVYAEKIELETDQLERQARERQERERQVQERLARERREREQGAAVSTAGTACQDNLSAQELFQALAAKFRSKNL